VVKQSPTIPSSYRVTVGDQTPAQPADAPSDPDCPPVSQMTLQSVIQKAAAAYNVAPNLIDAVIRQESGGNPCAVSEKGAMGLMQLMPATATQMGASHPFDVDQNVSAGTRLLADLMQRYHGDLNRVLGAYNAGTVAVDHAAGPPPFPETLNYIRSILEQIKQPYTPKLFDSPIR
jgi:soluble lytic murein transglycosylase-like protein